jgi:preprotein translocase subunit SecD
MKVPTALLLAVACAAAAVPAAFAADAPAPVTVAFRLVFAEPGPGREAMQSPGDDRTWYVEPEVLLDQSAFAAASAVPGEGDSWMVDVTMTPEGKGRLAALTRAHKGRRLGMIVDGVLVTAPVIRAAITEGRALVTGHFNEAEARRIAAGVMAER